MGQTFWNTKKRETGRVTDFPTRVGMARFRKEKALWDRPFGTTMGQTFWNNSSLFEQIWNDPEKLEDVTGLLCEQIASVYQENSPERIYFMMLYNIFSEFLEDISADVLPNDRTGYQDSLVWKKLFNFQRDAATGIINKLETYNGCILADSVGLGKTFTALESRLDNEKQFNRKVELNAQIRTVKSEFEKLCVPK